MDGISNDPKPQVVELHTQVAVEAQSDLELQEQAFAKAAEVEGTATAEEQVEMFCQMVTTNLIVSGMMKELMSASSISFDDPYEELY